MRTWSTEFLVGPDQGDTQDEEETAETKASKAGDDLPYCQALLSLSHNYSLTEWRICWTNHLPSGVREPELTKVSMASRVVNWHARNRRPAGPHPGRARAPCSLARNR